MPMKIAFIGFTKPQAGVIATSPATAPVAAPRTVGAPRCRHSMSAQVNPAAAAAMGRCRVGGQFILPLGRSRVEAEPPELEQGRAKHGEREIVRLMAAGRSRIFSQEDRQRQSRDARTTWTTIRRQSQRPRFRSQPLSSDPVGQRVVDQSPQEGEEQKG